MVQPTALELPNKLRFQLLSFSAVCSKNRGHSISFTSLFF
ncbi:hypothetical protein SLEP1_g1580 [Rubroshorea leprosula]|uniref:Uncharacterized protein n=1 Tax=Rubroshorea leprosula TaxID=152421 RepID=A0AAV5HIT4_9ROSI|nr:hypothetical protein SLEP1_g1580 [Rubroshorea leprosula]